MEYIKNAQQGWVEVLEQQTADLEALVLQTQCDKDLLSIAYTHAVQIEDLTEKLRQAELREAENWKRIAELEANIQFAPAKKMNRKMVKSTRRRPYGNWVNARWGGTTWPATRGSSARLRPSLSTSATTPGT